MELPVQLTIYIVIFFNIVCRDTSALKSDAYDLKLSLEEKNSLEIFKDLVTDRLPDKFMKTDFYLIRWLRASKLDVQGAQDLLFETVNWRKQNNISNILSEDWSDIEEECPTTFGGHDREGRPLRFVDAGECDLRRLGLKGLQNRLLRYFHYSNERQMQAVLQVQEETGKPVTRFVFLMDTSGINMRQHVCPSCIPTFFQWYGSASKHYPDFLAEAIVINAPAPVPVALSILRPVLSADVRDRITVFDSNKNVWMTYLDSRIDKSQRSERYGGTKQ